MYAEIFEFTGAKIKFGNARIEIRSFTEELNISTTAITAYRTDPCESKIKNKGLEFQFYPLFFALRDYFAKISTDKIEIRTPIPRGKTFLQNKYVQKGLAHRLLNGEYVCEGFVENALIFSRISETSDKIAPLYTIKSTI